MIVWLDSEQVVIKMEFGQEQVLKGELTVLATKNQDKIPKYRDSGQNQDKIPKDRDAGSVFTKCYTVW